tara:strand:+ start:5506 stop:5709 length:204 start_codon:yes stop_codon:yes gene_type:complete
MNDEEKYREVGNIVYSLTQLYSDDDEGKAQAMREAYCNRMHGFFSRAMRVKSSGRWGCYVSLVKKGE